MFTTSVRQFFSHIKSILKKKIESRRGEAEKEGEKGGRKKERVAFKS